MIKITPDIFPALRDKLDFVDRDSASAPPPQACGVVIPDLETVEFSGAESSLSLAVNRLKRAAATGNWYLFVIDSAWQSDNPRMRHLGLLPALDHDADWTTRIAATAVLLDGGGAHIRHCGLVRIQPSLFEKALGFIGKRRRFSFLAADIAGELSPIRILEKLHREGTQNVLHSKKWPFFDWIRLMEPDAPFDLVFLTSFGWVEEYCDFRYLALGERTALEALLNAGPSH